MMPLIHRPALTAVLVILTLFAVGCARAPSKPATPVPSESGVTGQPAPLSDAEEQLYQQATEHLKKQQYSDAVDALEELIDERPGLAGPRVNLALAHHRLDQPEAARSAAETALELNNESAEAHFVLALIEVGGNHYKEAEKHYTRSLEFKPDAPNTHYNLALLYDIYYQDPAKALPHYKQYLKLRQGEDEKTAAWVNHLEYSLNQR